MRASPEAGGQWRLAEVSGVSQPNIAAIETGARAPSLAMVTRLVRGRLRAAAARCHLDLQPLRPRYTDDGFRIAMVEGDEVRVGRARSGSVRRRRRRGWWILG